jgi:two-component system, NarL family, nitrate/nitrite sensor histidine kinase NarX
MTILRSFRGQFTLIFLGFMLLVGSSAAATFQVIQQQRGDAVILNLAGRQRMLAQQMVWLSLLPEQAADLNKAQRRFDETLQALRFGGLVTDAHDRPVHLPPPPNAEIAAQLTAVADSWLLFQQALSAGSQADLTAVADELVDQLDVVVSSFELEAQSKVSQLQRRQISFLVAALLLLVGGYLYIHRQLLQRLARLAEAVQQIGREPSPLPPADGADELGQLTGAFRRMATEISAAQDSLESRVAQRTQELTAAFEFSQETAQQLELEQLLQSAADRVRLLMKAESVSVCLLTDDQQMLELAFTHQNGRHGQKVSQPAAAGLPLQVIESRAAVALPTDCADCRFLRRQPDGYCAAVSLRVGRETLGAICVARQAGGPFTDEETRALTLLVNSAAVAIANARLIAAGRRQAEKMAIAAERERLAADLHDNLAQTLGYVGLKADLLQRMLAANRLETAITELEQVQTAVSGAYNQVRAALTGLQEGMEQVDGNLVADLAAHIVEFSQRTQLPVTYNHHPLTNYRLPAVMRTQLLHIVGEALTNVWKHAQADQAVVTLEQAHDSWQITVADNGRGFDPAAVNRGRHLGLRIMETRAARIGGQFTLESDHAGTRITVALPNATNWLPATQRPDQEADHHAPSTDPLS